MADAVAGLAIMLGVPEDGLRRAIGGPWAEEPVPANLTAVMTIVTGVVNPRTPERPLVAIRLEHEEGTVEVGHCVGVPLPNGRMQWALGEPRTSLPYDLEEWRDLLVDSDPRAYSMTPEELAQALLDELQAAIGRVADAAILRGTTW